jgi:hypothetical protein
MKKGKLSLEMNGLASYSEADSVINQKHYRNFMEKTLISVNDTLEMRNSAK